MNKKIKYTLIGIVIFLIVGQFIRPKTNTSDQLNKDDIRQVHKIDAPIQKILDKACMDCHSDNTVYPGYAKVFPVSWYLYNHVYGGKKKLDFSIFQSYSKEQQLHKLGEIKGVLDEKRMPLSSYVRLHSEAKLTAEEISALRNWSDQMVQKIRG